jgi:hypothetical protein
MVQSAVVMVLVAAVSLLGGATKAGLPADSGNTPPPCTRISVHKGPAGAATGSTHQTLRIRNVSRRTCRIGRLPSVAHVNRFHHMLGWPAKRQQPYRVVLRPGQVTRLVLQIPDAANFRPADCLAHRLPQLRVRVARDTSASFLNWDRRGCTTRYARSFIRAKG